MSHIRNLFHRPPALAQFEPAAVSVDRVLPGPAVVAIPEFQAEQAHVTPSNRVIFQANPRSPAADRIRLLRMRLREHWVAGKLKKLLITSPLAGDGKSTILMNLATALTERGKHSVLVIEADLHHSTLGPELKLNTWAGLTDCLQDEAISPLSHIRRIEPLGWHLLPAGEPRRNPTELLQTRALSRIIQRVSECFDWVLIDSPPVIPLTDALAIQHHTDASLLVVRAGQTPREATKQAVEMLGAKNIVGVVLNAVERRHQPSYQHHYYSSGGGHRDDA